MSCRRVGVPRPIHISPRPAKRIDMTSHKNHYPIITAPGVAAIGVVRMYDVMESRAERD
jgi:hypothetical protein